MVLITLKKQLSIVKGDLLVASLNDTLIRWTVVDNAKNLIHYRTRSYHSPIIKQRYCTEKRRLLDEVM